MVVALAIITAIGDINRLGEPQRLVSYPGLNPSVRQSKWISLTVAGSPSKGADIPAFVPRAAHRDR
ncbi:MAG TPA: transposase [Methylocella sp.]